MTKLNQTFQVVTFSQVSKKPKGIIENKSRLMDRISKGPLNLSDLIIAVGSMFYQGNL